MARPPIDNGTILITGASSGIGLELARQFALRTRAIILVARRLQLLPVVALMPKDPHFEKMCSNANDWSAGRPGTQLASCDDYCGYHSTVLIFIDLYI